MFRIFIVEDQYLMRYSLEILINSQEDMTVIGTAENGEDALKKIDPSQIDIVLMDIRMPVMDGITCTKKLKKKYPHLNVLILTTFNEDEYIYEALAYSANGYILKNVDNDVLVNTIRRAAQGQFIMPEEVAAKLSNRLFQLYDQAFFSMKFEKIFTSLEERNIKLNETEKEIVNHIMNKLNNRQISEKMHITEGTVKNYITHIYGKIGVKNRNALISYLKEINSKL